MNSLPAIQESVLPQPLTEASWETLALTFLAPKNPGTRRSYEYALRDFFSVAGKTPDQVTVADVAAYRARLEAQGNSSGTVACRLAALSSFYQFLCRPSDARGRSIVQGNPFAGVERPRVEPYQNARKMALADLLTILRYLGEKGDLASIRDRALILCYVFTGRRRREIANLRAGDLFEDDEGRLFYRYIGKRGKTGNRELPPPAAAAVREYLRASNRGELPEDAPIFVSTSGRTAGQAFTPDGILRMVKLRAKAAGVDPSRVRIHGLRHLAAALRRKAGAAVEEVQGFLDHTHLNTTAIYLEKTEGKEDTSWQGVAALLGIAG